MSGRSKHKSFPEESDKGKIRNQSQRIKELEKEVRRLKQELVTLNAAFKKAAVYMSDESKLLKVEELIKAAEKHQTLKEAMDEHVPTEKEVAERTREEVRLKWKKWAEENRATLPPESDDG